VVEDKLARAARSAQRLAQLSEVVRDENTPDLFAGDESRAVAAVLEIDARQGTLEGFELPPEVLAAAGMLVAPTKADEAEVLAPGSAAAPRDASGMFASDEAVIAGGGEEVQASDAPGLSDDSKTAASDTVAAAAADAAPRRRQSAARSAASAAAFADTVDALYGVIADQRRAARDHSRRMKWMLSIVVAALVVSVAIGVAQTLLLSRLARESAGEQQRIESMLLDQQAKLTGLLDAVAANARVAAAAPAASAPVAAPARKDAQTPVGAKRTKPQHGHKQRQ
jgi:hypothetical protein